MGRRVIRSNALGRAKPELDEYITEHLKYPEAFPYRLALAAVLIREIRTLKVAPLAKADYPPVQIQVRLKAWLSNRAVKIRGDWDPGILDVDVQLTAHGTVAPDGSYNVAPDLPYSRLGGATWCSWSLRAFDCVDLTVQSVD